VAERDARAKRAVEETRDAGKDKSKRTGQKVAGEVDPELRERAEQLLATRSTPDSVENLNDRDVMRLLHELRVHQIELEMQNEELRKTQLELAVSVEQYGDLYDFAPVGYLSVRPEGLIIRTNLTAAALLGTERRALTGKHLQQFVAKDHLSSLHALRRRLIIPNLTETAELRLQPGDDEAFWARLEIVTRQDPAHDLLVWQVAISNIDAQKRAETMLHEINEELEGKVLRRTEQLTTSNRQLLEEIGLRREAEQKLREREQQLEQRVAARTAELATLLSVARDITSSLDIRSVTEIVLNELRQLVAYEGCGVFLLDGNLLTLWAYNGPLPRQGLLQSQSPLDDAPLLKDVIARRRPVIVEDLFADTPLTRRYHESAGALQRQLMGGSRAWMGVPMMSQGSPIGVLSLDHRIPGFFNSQHADLVLTLASQAAIAITNARLYSQAQRLAAVEERQRLARELHDTVAQTFYSIALSAHAANARLRDNSDIAGKRLNHILELADAGLTEMKALIFDLQAEGIRRDGLVQALQRHVSALAARNDIHVLAELGNEPEASLATKEAVYGIAREALQNVVRHANASQLSIKLSYCDDALCVEVRDNGKGFTTEGAGSQTLGIRSMEERASAAGGRLEVTSALGQGATVRAQIPVREDGGRQK
jgi:PAS domain S-box-containing protein